MKTLKSWSRSSGATPTPSSETASNSRWAYSGKQATLKLGPRDSGALGWSLERSLGWYDLVVTVEGDQSFEHRFAGHFEDGQDSITDPATGGLRLED